MIKKILAILFFIGVGLIIAGIALTKGDFSNVANAFTATEDYYYVEKDSNESINGLAIDLVSNNINFYKSEDETIKVNYYESEYDKINVTFDNSILSITGTYKSRFRFFNFTYIPDKYEDINIYLPNSFDGNVNVDLTSGKLDIKDFNFEKLNANLTSGSINFTNVNVNTDLNLDLTSGNATLNNVRVTNNATFIFTSGLLNINTMQANKIKADLTSGSGNLHNITANHISGNLTSGYLKIIIIGSKEDYSADLDVTSGVIYYDGVKLSSQKINIPKEKSIIADVTTGDINIEFINN